MTIEVSNAWPMKPIREMVRVKFPDVQQERLDATTLNLTVEDADCDRLTDWLDTYPWGCGRLEWRLV